MNLLSPQQAVHYLTLCSLKQGVKRDNNYISISEKKKSKDLFFIFSIHIL